MRVISNQDRAGQVLHVDIELTPEELQKLADDNELDGAEDFPVSITVNPEAE